VVWLSDPSTMSDAQLIAEVAALEAAEDRAALSDPASLMLRLMRGYKRRPHLVVITNEMRRVLAGEIDRLLIMVPPQTGKTVTAVVGGSVWWLANRPSDRVIIGSYGDSLAVDRGRDSRRIVQEHGHRFGLGLARGSESVKDWRLTAGGGVLSVGVGAGVTGKPGDIAIIDDPHKSRAEADSRPFRDRAYRWLSADIISRLAPGAPLILVMTPWHPDDLAARVTADEGKVDEGGRWKVIRMPALCDDPGNDPLNRSLGAPLTHPRISESDTAGALAHWHDKRRSSTAQDWAALYMCDPKPATGALVSRELLRSRRCYTAGSECHPCDTTPVRSAVAVDPSGGGRDTAGIVGGYLGSDGRLYLTHDWSGVMPSDVWAKRVCEMAADIDADMIIFEKNFGGDMAGRLIRTAWSALRSEEEKAVDRANQRYGGLCPLVRGVSAKKSKRLRADPVAQQFIEDMIRTARYLPELEEEWATWQEGSSDSPGRIDASVYLAYGLLPIPRGGSGGSAAPSGTLPTTGMSPLARGSTSGGFGHLGH